uniref:guanylate cyclase n=1 Tax=Plectus sambesii TaxID=2011161 RepID=A0A914UUD5_9BILA
MQLLLQMRAAVHDNVNQFIGLCFNNPGVDLMITWKYCARGTLKDWIQDEKLKFDDNFKCAFMKNIVAGLEYLHTSSIGHHGCLSSRTCQIDGHWNLKLSDYGLEKTVILWGKTEHIAVVPGELLPHNEWIFLAPEMAKFNNLKNALNEPDSKAQEIYTNEQLQLADMYSFGMVLYEVLFRKEPFQEMESFAAMMAVLNFEPTRGQQPLRPVVPKDIHCHPDLMTLMRQCWSQLPHLRPSIRRVKKVTTSAMNTRGSLVDQMVQMLEEHSTDLEKTVSERTALLEEAKHQSESLLQQILPSSIAKKLKMGRPVRPKLYNSATVLFSDIVGFTRLCSSSTPMEVINLLNSLFSGFDVIIRQYDACKIATIGDSFLVVSGIPKSNGNQHAMIIADIALQMREFLDNFRVPHRPNERMQCRWGCHTGPITAAVVGVTSPRYVVLGETVEIASAMEKSSIKGMIHCSASTFRLLARNYPEFKCKLRGQFNIEVH